MDNEVDLPVRARERSGGRERRATSNRGSSVALRNAVAGCALLVVAFVALLVTPSGRTSSSSSSETPLVICDVFGDRYCGQALRVAWCESRLHTTARNGQYLGLFQMGSYERRNYGHGPDARTQARAARRYFVATGRDWSPWSCRWAANQ